MGYAVHNPELPPPGAVITRRPSAINFSHFQSEVFTQVRHFPLKCPPAPPIYEDHAMSFRRDYITKPIFSWARGVLPSMSDTEREALEAGDVWWDADLFTGNPDWSPKDALRGGIGARGCRSLVNRRPPVRPTEHLLRTIINIARERRGTCCDSPI